MKLKEKRRERGEEKRQIKRLNDSKKRKILQSKGRNRKTKKREKKKPIERKRKRKM